MLGPEAVESVEAMGAASGAEAADVLGAGADIVRGLGWRKSVSAEVTLRMHALSLRNLAAVRSRLLASDIPSRHHQTGSHHRFTSMTMLYTSLLPWRLTEHLSLRCIVASSSS